MRPHLLLFPALLASCGHQVSQREILRRSQIEVVSREPWAPTAVLVVDEKPGDFLQSGWIVKAGEFDFSDHPNYRGLHFVPGTERKLRFTRDGCLISYTYAGSNCHYPVAPAPVPGMGESGK